MFEFIRSKPKIEYIEMVVFSNHSSDSMFEDDSSVGSLNSSSENLKSEIFTEEKSTLNIVNPYKSIEAHNSKIENSIMVLENVSDDAPSHYKSDTFLTYTNDEIDDIMCGPKLNKSIIDCGKNMDTMLNISYNNLIKHNKSFKVTHFYKNNKRLMFNYGDKMFINNYNYCNVELAFNKPPDKWFVEENLAHIKDMFVLNDELSYDKPPDINKFIYDTFSKLVLKYKNINKI